MVRIAVFQEVRGALASAARTKDRSEISKTVRKSIRKIAMKDKQTLGVKNNRWNAGIWVAMQP